MNQNQWLALACFVVMQIPVRSFNAFAGILLGQLCHVMNAKKCESHHEKYLRGNRNHIDAEINMNDRSFTV